MRIMVSFKSNLRFIKIEGQPRSFRTCVTHVIIYKLTLIIYRIFLINYIPITYLSQYRAELYRLLSMLLYFRQKIYYYYRSHYHLAIEDYNILSILNQNFSN